jgi:hypothetical protein
VNEDPFAVLGLPARADLSDEDVRAARRRIAAATHPDREDGGNPARFGAAAAYAMLRTSFGRGEALADLAPGAYRPARRSRHRARHGGSGGAGHSAARHAAQVAASGHSWRLTSCVILAAAVSAGALIVAGWGPGTVGLLAGALTVTGWGLWRWGGRGR